jgi:hypothetical protein
MVALAVPLQIPALVDMTAKTAKAAINLLLIDLSPAILTAARSIWFI